MFDVIQFFLRVPCEVLCVPCGLLFFYHEEHKGFSQSSQCFIYQLLIPNSQFLIILTVWLPIRNMYKPLGKWEMSIFISPFDNGAFDNGAFDNGACPIVTLFDA